MDCGWKKHVANHKMNIIISHDYDSINITKKDLKFVFMW